MNQTETLVITKDLLASFGTMSILAGARSTSEALPLKARGKIRLPVSLAKWLAQATLPLREAPFTHEIVLAAQRMPLPRPDRAVRYPLLRVPWKLVRGASVFCGQVKAQQRTSVCPMPRRAAALTAALA